MLGSEATLAERAAHLYRQLLLLRRVFDGVEQLEGPFLSTADPAEAQALMAAVHGALDDLAQQARTLVDVPFPLSDWRPGDGSDDERWRGLTEVERRDLLSLVGAHEHLLALLERGIAPGIERPERHEQDVLGPRPVPPPADHDPGDLLRAERARITRLRQDMAFLERRRTGS